MKRDRALFGVFLFSLVFSAVLLAPNGVAQSEENSFPHRLLTVYNSGPAFLLKVERVNLAAGRNDLQREVTEKTLPSSFFIEPESGQLIEARLRPGISSKRELIERYVGKKVSLQLCPSGGCFNREGTIIAILDGDPLLETNYGQKVLLKDPSSYEFTGVDSVSAEDFSPHLSFSLYVPEGGSSFLRWGYRTNGFVWDPLYKVVLNEGNNELTFNGQGMVRNSSDKDLRVNELTLIAGKPADEGREESAQMDVRAKAFNLAMAPEEPKLSKTFEYYSYSIERPVELRSGEISYLPLFSRSGVGFEKSYVYEPGASSGVKTFVEFENTEEAGAGLALAEGNVDIYGVEGDSLQFLGRDRVPGTAKGEEVRLTVGLAFDLKGERIVKEREKIGERSWEEKISISLENHKTEAASVEVIERLKGSWSILSSELKFEQIDSDRISFQLELQAGEEKEFSYSYRYEY